MGDTNIAENWKDLSGDQNWKDLLEPLNIDLRRYIIHYGERVQVTGDAFNSEKVSKNAGSCRYAKKDLFAKVFLEQGNPFKYSVTKYFYATSSFPVVDPWVEESNWMGYVAVATDEGKAALGRRDILVAWRGTIKLLEWMDDAQVNLRSASEILGKEHDPKVHEGFYSIYTTENPSSPFNNKSTRDQVNDEIKRLVEEYKDEDIISITVAGHSLGAALATLIACLDGSDEGGYVNPPDFYSGSASNPVFGSDFWKVEINTVEDSYPAEAGFVKARSDPVVGKSGRF